MDHNPHQSADQRSVDADILKIAAHGAFQPFGHCRRVLAPHCVADQADSGVAVAVDGDQADWFGADGGSIAATVKADADEMAGPRPTGQGGWHRVDRHTEKLAAGAGAGRD